MGRTSGHGTVNRSRRVVAAAGCLKKTNTRGVFHGRGRSSIYCWPVMQTDGQDKGRKLSCTITAARGGLSGDDEGVAG